MVRDSGLFYLGLVLICLTSAIITRLLKKLHVGGEALLHLVNISRVFIFIGYVTVALSRRYSSTMVVSTN